MVIEMSNAETLRYLMELVSRDLGEAEDNLYRAELSFRGQNLNVLYGESGETKGSIIEGYRKWEAQAKEAQRFLEAMPIG